MRNAFESENWEMLPEMFHSEFLGAALRTSLNGDRSLFEGVWELCAPDFWCCPSNARVEPEHSWDGHRKIDILIRDMEYGLAVGIEVNTRDKSVESGHLEACRRQLCAEFGEGGAAIALLSPFNRQHAESVSQDAAEMLQTVAVFEEFSKGSGLMPTRHLSWLDVADIHWPGGGDLWKEYREHVEGTIASIHKLENLVTRNRRFDDFFGKQAAREFWNRLRHVLRNSESRDHKGGKVIELGEFEGDPGALAAAVRILIKHGERVAHRVKQSGFSEGSRQQFVNSEHRRIHEALFGLVIEFPCVWLDGGKDYSLRVGHRDHGDSVSLVTSQGTGRLLIGQRRWPARRRCQKKTGLSQKEQAFIVCRNSTKIPYPT